MKIAVIGAGNGGQAMAAHFSLLGHEVSLYSRDITKLSKAILQKGIELTGEISGFGIIHLITNNIELAISDAELIMITTVASAHRSVAEKIAPFVKSGQIIVLNPGRTLGALDFTQSLYENTNVKVYIGEAQSLIYACRIEADAFVRVIGVKDRVMFSAYPSSDTDYILQKINGVFNCFIKASSILQTGLENIGAILHPAVVLFNAAAIERGNTFYFYNDMTPAIASFLEKLDNERLLVGKSFGITLHSVSDWVSYAYSDIEGNSLCDKMQHNKAYYKIQAPTKLNSRLLTEDVPTGILPIIELGKMNNVKCPLMTSVLSLTEGLLEVDFVKNGRTLKNLKIDELSKDDFLKTL